MTLIQARVNPRLLTKADRLFTGSQAGRIIELLQNARRAHATRVEITNADGRITLHDNGRGIQDFQTLLDLGGSGWNECIENSEDPAGVGLFCLAPREVSIRSNGKRIHIGGASWSGTPVRVREDPHPIPGTMLHFWDEPWGAAEVTRHAVFTGMEVAVDGTPCPQQSFVSAQAAHHPDLGCRIEVCEREALGEWHYEWTRDRYHYGSVLVNFHGQIVAFDYIPISERELHYLVDLTGEPTGIRLMLPARTRLVENGAFRQLTRAIEREAFRFIQRRGHHALSYKEFQRALEHGIPIPEARATFDVGLISSDVSPEPVAVSMPDGFPLAKCYRMSAALAGTEEFAETHAHLLAALGTFEGPFIPVAIRSEYDGYSWADLPTIERVEVRAGKELHCDYVGSGQLVCVDQLTITASARDGRVFSSPVCMALRVEPPAEGERWGSEAVLVTLEARDQLSAEQIWYHLGGYNEEGDTLETQAHAFEQELQRFWADTMGPDESLRQQLLSAANDAVADWQRIELVAGGVVTLIATDGTSKVLSPPAAPLRTSL